MSETITAATGAGQAIALVDGRLVRQDELAIRADDRGLVGNGVFEAIKVVDGTPFALRRHLARLEVSARPLRLPIDLDAVHAAIDGVLPSTAELASPCWLRVTVTAGPARMASGDLPTIPTVIAAVAPMDAWKPHADVVVLPWTRNERGALAGLKTLSYLENGLGLRHARERGADEGIFANTRGDLCEGTGTNVFVIHEGRIVTPPLAAGCLPGVTRGLVLESAPGIVEEALPIDALHTCDEAFLTSTSRDIHPIATVDGRRLARVPGPLTAHLQATFADLVRIDLDP